MQNWDKIPFWVFVGSHDEQFIPESVVNVCRQAGLACHAKIVPNARHLSILKQAPNLIMQVIASNNTALIV